MIFYYKLPVAFIAAGKSMHYKSIVISINEFKSTVSLNFSLALSVCTVLLSLSKNILKRNIQTLNKKQMSEIHTVI